MKLFSLAVLALALIATATALRTTDVQDVCAGSLTATVTFQTSCTTIDVADASCWTPHTPGASDVVLFPSGTSATMPFAMSYTPISATSVVVASGATVILNGSAIAVTQCLQVLGSLSLAQSHSDNGSISSIAFAADPSVPEGTDCATVSQGFSPRLCGPGLLYVSGVLSVSGEYASVWSPAVIAAGGAVSFPQNAFLWGNWTNFGTISASGLLYFHGALTNAASGVINVLQLRPDYWTTTPGTKDVTLSLVNFGTVNFALRTDAAGGNFNFVATTNWVPYSGPEVDFVTLQILNHGNLNFNGIMRGNQYYTTTFAMESVQLINYGTTTWAGLMDFSGMGSASNYGLFVANKASVWYQNFQSIGGTTQTINGGQFSMGLSAIQSSILKGVGMVGPYITAVRLVNTKMIGDGDVLGNGGSGRVVAYEPIEIHGEVVLEGTATFTNSILYKSPLLHERSTGRFVVRGVYQAGVAEVLAGARSSLAVHRPGAFVIPTRHTVSLSDDAAVHFANASMLELHGTLNTVLGSSKNDKRLRVDAFALQMGSGSITGEVPLSFVSANSEDL